MWNLRPQSCHRRVFNNIVMIAAIAATTKNNPIAFVWHTSFSMETGCIFQLIHR